jgi:hypothetical protein
MYVSTFWTVTGKTFMSSYRTLFGFLTYKYLIFTTDVKFLYWSFFLGLKIHYNKLWLTEVTKFRITPHNTYFKCRTFPPHVLECIVHVHDTDI